jgi:hypothetical protein
MESYRLHSALSLASCGELAMRSLLAALAVVAGTSAASAEVWLIREGVCGEYRSRWNVEQDQAGIWVGSAEHVHVGGPCEAGTGAKTQSKVRSVIAGGVFFAVLQSEPTTGAGANTGSICSYYGPIQGDRVSGVEVCERVARMLFALRFRGEGERDAQQRAEQRPLEQQDDDWLDNPQTHDRDGGPAGFSLEPGPGIVRQ